MILYEDDIERLNKIQDYILSNLHEDLSIDSLCSKIKVSNSTLRRHFAFYFKKPIHNYILEQRLNKALELLCNKSKNVAEIALLVGYNNRCSFTHAFTKFYGLPPIDCLKNQQLETESLIKNFDVNRDVAF